MSADAPSLLPDTADCPRCQKPLALCVCDEVAPIDNGVELLVLQHPQEQDRLLGSARLAARHFKNATFKVGLSWPSLSKILGREIVAAAVFILGYKASCNPTCPLL